MITTTCTGVLTVAVPVTDQDRSKALFGQLGFETHLDAELQPGFRWLEMRVPGSETTLSLVRASENLPAGIDTGIRLGTPDARAAHAALAELGCTVGALLEWETAPPMFVFRDHDGNAFYLTQVDEAQHT
ncbi:VOC family protein [Nocardia sp. NPDC056000]|uniref:VOC family protein n=1 Tax=Nocardia sp. NPDC056000 TaxID=3345674 RepID=UPI0035E2494C